MTLIIGFGNKARQGKNAAAEAIHAAYPRETKIFGFADDLYAVCRAQGMQGKDARRLQETGERFRQDGHVEIAGVQVRTHRRFWIDRLLDRVAIERPPVALVIDVRHVEEAEACDVAIKVSRFHADGRQWLADDRDPHHISETALDEFTGWDYKLVNVDGLRAGFEARVLSVYRDLRVAHGIAS